MDGWINYLCDMDIYDTGLYVLGLGFFSCLVSIFIQTFFVEVYFTCNIILVLCVQYMS